MKPDQSSQRAYTQLRWIVLPLQQSELRAERPLAKRQRSTGQPVATTLTARSYESERAIEQRMRVQMHYQTPC